MNKWKDVIFDDLINIKHGYAFKGQYFSDSETENILVTPGNFKIGGGFKEDKIKYYNGEFPKEYILKSKDIIVTMTDLSKLGDTLGYPAIVPYKKNKIYLHNQRIGLVIFKNNDLYPIYLYWRLRCKDYQNYIVGCASGTTVKHTSPKSIMSFKTKLPTYIEQKAIADTLSCLDDKIELNNTINKKLEEMAQAIFKSWFVDFEPFKDGEFEESELGRIPKGWRVGTLGEIANITMGQSPAGTSYNEKKEGITFYQGRTDFGVRYPTIRLYTTEPKRFASKGDILLSVRAPVGDINVANENCCIGRGLASLKSQLNCNSYLLYQLLDLKNSFNVYNGEGTVFGSINKDSLDNIKVLIPIEKNIKEFQYIVQKLDNLIENNSCQIKTLIDIRDSLLPKLMSGEVRVPFEETK